MTCAQGLLRLLWGGPKLECYGTGRCDIIKFFSLILTSKKKCRQCREEYLAFGFVESRMIRNSQCVLFVATRFPTKL